MHRRHFLSGALRTAAIASLAPRPSAWAERVQTLAAPNLAPVAVPDPRHELNRYRFGVNYTPSQKWWFCWNDWNADPIRRDLDAITDLGADHLRILLIWPYFQPNPKWVSPLHLERLDQLLSLMAERHLDAVVTVFTGQLSGWYFLPPFNKAATAFYTDTMMWQAQELFIRELGRVLAAKNNVIGFDVGNEINTCWSTDPATGDAWMAKLFALMEEVFPKAFTSTESMNCPGSRPTLSRRKRSSLAHCL